MKLAQFTGGLQTRRAPELLSPAEAVQCTNVDLQSEQIAAAKGPISLGKSFGAYPIYYHAKQKWVASNLLKAAIEYQGVLYWADGTVAKKYDGATEHDLGIAQPGSSSVSAVGPDPVTDLSLIETAYNTSLGAASGSGGALVAGDFDYLVTISVGSAIVSTKELTHTLVGPDDQITVTSTGNLPSGSTVKIARKYSGVYRQLYSGAAHTIVTDTVQDISSNPAVDSTISTNKVKVGATYTFGLSTVDGSSTRVPQEQSIKMTVDGFLTISTSDTSVQWYLKSGLSFYELSTSGSADYAVNLDTTGVSVWEDNGVSGTVQYVYTYYNVNDGTESQPSPVSIELSTQNSRVSTSVTASPDPQVTHIKLYRIGNNLLSFTEVAELSNTSTTYLDIVPDGYVTGQILSSSLNGKAPAGLKYLVQTYNVFFGAVGTKLYFTRDIGNPNYWPETYYIEFYDTVTGIAPVANGVVVTTRYKAFLVTGTNVSTFVKYELSGDQGGVSHHSIAARGGQALLVSTDGICTTSGQPLQVLSKSALGKATLDVVNAVVVDEVYYVQQASGKILAFDFRYVPRIVEYDFGTSYLVVANDVLHGVVDGELYQLFAGEPTNYVYQTGNLTDGSLTSTKLYKKVHCFATGVNTLSISINGKVVQTKQLVEGLNDISVPQEWQRGEYTSFLLTGTGIVKELEYKVEHKKNV